MDKYLVPDSEAKTEQGYIEFRDDGNMTVYFNNLEFKDNPLYSDLSFISVYVFKSGADVTQNCCSGSSCEVQIQKDSCQQGMGFSNEVGFLRNSYQNHPLKPFDKDSTSYTMPVYDAKSDGTPTSYQGEYNTFNNTNNIVEDRTLYDLYIGVFYNVFDITGRFRAVNKKAVIGDRTLYTQINPDLLSPLIPIESRFFKRSNYDLPGSRYQIPHLSSWTYQGSIDLELDKRGYLVFNEIGNSVFGGNSKNDFIEIYNPTSYSITLDDVIIQRFTGTLCDTLGYTGDKVDLSGVILGPHSYYVVARTDTLLSASQYDKKGYLTISDDDCFALTKSSYSIYDTNDTDIIDFVGLDDIDQKNHYWGTAPASYLSPDLSLNRCPDGTNTKDNGADFSLQSNPTPKSANNCSDKETLFASALKAKDLLINEVYADVDTTVAGCTDATDEFIEVYNNTLKTINLAGVTIRTVSSSGSVDYIYTFGSVQLSSHAVIALVSQNSGCYTSTTLSGYNVLFDTADFSLSNTGDSIVILNNDISLTSPQSSAPNVDTKGESIVLDTLGYGSATYYEASPVGTCVDKTIQRIQKSNDTNNNLNDFTCNSSPTPGR